MISAGRGRERERRAWLIKTPGTVQLCRTVPLHAPPEVPATVSGASIGAAGAQGAGSTGGAPAGPPGTPHWLWGTPAPQACLPLPPSLLPPPLHPEAVWGWGFLMCCPGDWAANLTPTSPTLRATKTTSTPPCAHGPPGDGTPTVLPTPGLGSVGYSAMDLLLTNCRSDLPQRPREGCFNGPLPPTLLLTAQPPGWRLTRDVGCLYSKPSIGQ